MLEKYVLKPALETLDSGKIYFKNKDSDVYNTLSDHLIIEKQIDDLKYILKENGLFGSLETLLKNGFIQKNDSIQIMDKQHRFHWVSIAGRVLLSMDYERQVKGRSWLLLFKRSNFVKSFFLNSIMSKCMKDSEKYFIDFDTNDITSERESENRLLFLEQKFATGLFNKRTKENFGYLVVSRMRVGYDSNIKPHSH